MPSTFPRALAPLARLFAIGLASAACAATPAPAPRAAPTATGGLVPAGARLVDLTHAFDADTIVWPTEEPFQLVEEARGVTDRGFFYASNRFAGPEHGGTHLDAPMHFARDASTVDRIALDRLIGPAVVVDVSAPCAEDRDHRITLADLERWERAHGPIPRRAIVLLATGFGRFWPDRARYMGTAKRGPEAVGDLHFPGLAADAAAWLVEARDVRAVGIDTASIDHGPSTTFDAHRTLAAHEVPAFENVANLEQLPPTGATVIALPMKIGGGTGAPLRAVAIVPPP